MKKKIVIIVMLLSIIVSMIPSVAFAATTNIDKNITSNKIESKIKAKSKLKYHKPTKAQIRQVGSELEYYKQYILEKIEETYAASTDNEYTEEIKNLIDTYYNDLEVEINDVDDINELISGTINFLGMLIPDFTEDVYVKTLILEKLVSWDNSVVKGTEKISDLKTKLNKAVNDAMDCYINSDEYNDYYQSIASGGKQELLDEVKKVNDFMTLATTITILEYKFGESFPDPSVSFALDDISGSCSYYDGDDDFYEDNYYDDDYDDDDSYDYAEFLEDMGMVYVPGLEADLLYVDDMGIEYIQALCEDYKVFTNKQIDDVKKFTTFYIDAYVNKQLPAANYDTNLDSLKAIANTAIKNINSSSDMDEIVTLYKDTYSLLVKKAGVEYKAKTSATYNKANNQIMKLSNIYTDKSVYSDFGISTNGEIIDFALTAVDLAFKDIEIPSDFIEKLEAKLKTTKTYKQELAELKKELLEELNTFKNNKKYNQTKIKAIINEATKKINASTDMDEVYDLYYEYYEKAENAINKYKITTKKTGKGTITKSKTVTYGSNFTVKMTPKKGYKIKSVIVDGKKVKNKTKYTFKKVVKAHTIKVVFVKKK